jgi:hypothetical protein
MANIQRNFIAGRMNKSLDERLVPNGEYVNAVNVRLGSTEDSEIGAVENSKGNVPLTEIQYVDGTKLSSQARCIGAFEDGANLVIYWFVHDPAFTQGATGKLDLIISFDVETGELIYHVVSIDDGGGINTTLNFNPNFLITGVNKIDNLLFFTDNYNPPRVVNINKNYGDPRPAVLTDDFNQDEILVIKKPPTSAPIINSFVVPSITDAYLEDKFICFGYRYKYENEEYSAISQFTEPAFSPSSFNFSSNSYLNEGMINRFNAVTITFNSGDKSVTDVQVVFKESNSSSIKVLETFDVSDRTRYPINSPRSETFTNRKIYTVLPDSEILRLFDNVPQLAKAQTLMGNRIVYGNYFEGYDLKTSKGSKINFGFESILKSESINFTNLSANESKGAEYSINPPGSTAPAVEIDDSAFFVQLLPAIPSPTNPTGFLTAGATLTFTFGIAYSSNYATGSPTPVPLEDVYYVTWSYTLIRTYTSVFQLATDVDFVSKIGTLTNIKPINTASEGTTLTDAFNAALPVAFDATYTNIVQTGRTNSTPTAPAGQPLEIIATASSTTLGIQANAAVYDKGSSPLDPIISYFRFTNVTASIRTSPSIGSLHSNRGYEIGMVYMDDFNRASTAQVSDLNSVNLPCSVSNTKNFIQVQIPESQLAPSWATKYKFVIKPTATNYQTIYSNIVYSESGTNSSYFLLDGENAQKVEAGDRLIIKADATGALNTCTYATVLEKQAQGAGFITIYDEAGDELEVFGGTYMKINASNFSINTREDSIINSQVLPSTARGQQNSYPVVAYPMFTVTESSGQVATTLVYDVPVGTRIKMEFEFRRDGVSKNEDCLKKSYTLEKEFTASRNYGNMQEWFEGDNIASTLNEGIEDVADDETIINSYIPTPNTSQNFPPFPVTVTPPQTKSVTQYNAVLTADEIKSADYFGSTATQPNTEFYYRFYVDQVLNNIYLLVSGSSSCGGGDKREHRESSVKVNFTVSRSNSTYVFETEPEEALPDVWYENSESYDINGDFHLGNVQNQTLNQPGIVNTGFFDCYSFGNGVESNKIRDSIKGEQVTLGNRTFTTSNEEYKKAHRFADLTYSGVFNDESNVNRLNEFNLGLLNFKPLEETYGDVEILFARETDILVLQEDKISYVLAGKNLLSDSTGGGVVTSVPEVLGTQIARIEDYGISNHPESFAEFGANKFFTDAKRNVVIKLTGSSAQNEILTVISNEGMRSWFRDLFAEASSTQKLGGYDPYMQEYVFTTNTIVKPETEICTACGVTKNITIVAGQEYVYCVDIGEDTGPPSKLYYVEIDYVIPFEDTDLIVTEGTEQQIVSEAGLDLETEGQVSGTGYTIQAIYDGVTYTTGVVYQSGTLVFPKPNPTPSEVVLIVTSDSLENDTIQVTVKCPEEELFSVYSITLTTNANANQFSHTEFGWRDASVVSPIQSDLVTFLSSPNDPIVSQYRELEGPQGSNIIPPDGATIIMRSNKIDFDNFQFDPAENEFRYLRTDALFENNSTDMGILLAASIKAVPIDTTGAPNLYSAEFGLPSGGNKLYLIYDLRNSLGQELCYSQTSLVDACCNCTFTPTPTPTPTPVPTPVIPVYDYFIGIDCVSLEAVYLKSDQTLGVVVGDEVQYSFGGNVEGCASLYATGGNGNSGQVTVRVAGCGDSRCSV